MNKDLKNIEIANNIVSRGLGLIGRKNWGKSKGMLIENSNAIHTFFVRFPIDVVFLDKDFKIVQITTNLKPFKFSPVVWKAKHTLELPKGAVKEKSLQVGDKINIL